MYIYIYSPHTYSVPPRLTLTRLPAPRYLYIYTHICIYTDTCVCMCIHVYIHTHMCRASKTYFDEATSSMEPIYIHVHIYRYMPSYVYIYRSTQSIISVPFLVEGFPKLCLLFARYKCA